MFIVSIFFVALSFFIATYIAYFLYVRRYANKPWRIKFDHNFEPEISILIPVHNEENTIVSKLENIKDVSYPKEKIEIIVANDASNDNTLGRVMSFIQQNPELNIKIVNQNIRVGKSRTLNKALSACTKPIIIVSDADTLWPSDMLQNGIRYLSDPKIGAVTGWGINKNLEESWVVKAESAYLSIINLIRLGESKIHSTIRFEGGFCAYKRSAFTNFDHETGSDDSGTALEIVQRGYRAILAPEAFFYTSFPTKFTGKFKVKLRRANQLIGLWAKCLKLLLRGCLLLPKRIAVAEITLFIFNPLIFLALIITGVLAIFNLFLPVGLIILFIIILSLLFARQIFLEVVIDQFILLFALVSFLFKRRYISWEKPN
jgi:cellulose synthase/poly-beta-1,6-N-acetylglucosamine synthase-like glycosyltransferase